MHTLFSFCVLCAKYVMYMLTRAEVHNLKKTLFNIIKRNVSLLLILSKVLTFSKLFNSLWIIDYRQLFSAVFYPELSFLSLLSNWFSMTFRVLSLYSASQLFLGCPFLRVFCELQFKVWYVMFHCIIKSWSFWIIIVTSVIYLFFSN